ncbi:DUF3159 domain-containing protein [Gulosibacter chungangensis]|uniref:DUF3159 domain-containing protein n=1 Tax=Gulosibacter chungangensis TaxID=979746 RepID=A0A7J5BDB2_9MICO|nr:DUF3159 domain-containing protein [Gulosibacter chungangensis]KAB1644032.1 DUF3159 domain-containing protein [Gulosibacter chungangensis]
MAEEVTPESMSAEDAQLQQKIRAAAQNSALGKVADSSSTGEALLVSMGGWRGIVEALLPGLLFLVLYVVTTRVVADSGMLPFGLEPLWISVGVPALAGAIFLLIRCLRKEPTASALGGLIGLLVSGFFALRSGEGTDYFLVGFWTNTAYGLALLVSMLVGWPLLGIISGAMYGSWRDWRKQPRILAWMQLITGVWVGLFAARLVVQLPMYFAGAVEALGVARLLMGAPLFGVLVVITVLFVRAVFKPLVEVEDAEQSATTAPDSGRA